mmetsp:Transcript_17538/g.25954  ORF Transcript_17538/g.25954 Transcript_17538/m.25954 type:complete len:235 (+) Transcript_17538:79-783(+)
MEENSHFVLLRETKEIQDQTQDTLDRILIQAAETEEVGQMALASLAEHDEQLDTILNEAARTRENLKETSKLQNKFAHWNLRFGNRRRARKAQRKKKLQDSVKEKSDFRIGEKKDKVVFNKENEERKILFGKLADRAENKPTVLEMKSNKNYVEAPLSLADKKSLEEIAIRDESLIDPALDALGEQLDGLMSLSLCMNEAISKEEHKLNTVGNKLDKVCNRVDLANFRIVETTK